MVLNIFVVVLILGITFMQSIFGLFSGLINLLCCLTAMVAAFGFTDLLNNFVTEQALHPSYTLPICFVLLFFLTHLVLRLAADNLIRGNVRMPMYVDWAGAGFCGFIIAMITVGVTVLGFLMLPWGGRVMMFSRYEREAGLDSDKRAVFLHNSVGWFFRPDEFTVGLFNLLSSGSLRGETTFASIYPDFPQWVFWTGNTVQSESATAPFRDNKGDGFGERGLKAVSWWEQKQAVPARYRAKLPKKDDVGFENPFQPVEYKAGLGNRLIGVRLTLTRDSADRDEGTPHHRFRSTMVRIVGDVGGEPREYAARLLGGADPSSDEFRLADIDNNFAIPCAGDTPLDVIFEVDQDFKPRFVEYRRFARALLPPEPVAAAPGDRLLAAASGEQKKQATMVGALRFIGAIIEDGTGDKTTLPFNLDRNAIASAEVEIVDGKLKSGRIAGSRAQLESKVPIGAIREFALPEGKRLFQFRCKARTAETLAGQVFNFVAATANQYIATDDQAGEYPMNGYYAIVKRGKEDYFELFISPPDDPAYNQMLDFKHITNQELRSSDAIVGMLFFTRGGVSIGRVQNQLKQGVEFKVPGYKMGG